MDETEMNALIDAAEERAKLYDDDRDCIKADVMNAFFAGAEYARQAALGKTPSAWWDRATGGFYLSKASIPDPVLARGGVVELFTGAGAQPLATQTEDLAGAVWDGPNTASQVDPCMGLPAKGRG